MAKATSILALLAVFAIAQAFASPAAAQRQRATNSVYFYVSPSGSDSSNDCVTEASPCATAQYAYTRLMTDWDFAGFGATIKLANGTYASGINMAGQPVGTHLVTVVGNQDLSQNCIDRTSVIVQGNASVPIFWFQDLAIGVVRCLTVQAACTQGDPCSQRAQGVTAFSCRQTPASDIAFINFDALPGGAGVVAADQCGINLGGDIWISNNMTQLLFAVSQSRITIGGGVPFVVRNGINITYFALSYQLSLIEFRGGVSITNPQLVQGASASRVWRAGGMALNGLALPGGSVTQADPNAPGFTW